MSKEDNGKSLNEERRRKKIKRSYLGFKAFLILNETKQSEVALLLNLNVKVLNNKINGYSDFTLNEVMAICDKYNTGSDIFLKDSHLKIIKI